jgi:hypothetical protein
VLNVPWPPCQKCKQQNEGGNDKGERLAADFALPIPMISHARFSMSGERSLMAIVPSVSVMKIATIGSPAAAARVARGGTA